ncbi:MAG TPA: undecaprenyl-diphosphate phosphatase [Thermoanaerobaculia bacterium]|nr:undecaprenyl-diphosphate phosphatase [Thermoanaerobaculia bacterium]
MTPLQAIVLGLAQGLTEFIPISSTAHLRIVPALLGWGDPGAAASAVIQLGTLLAVLIYFARDIAKITVAWVRGLLARKPFEEYDARLGWYIIAGSIPIGIVGLLFKDFIETGARSLWIIAASLIGLAIFLWIAERVAARSQLRVLADITLTDAILIGLGQCLALNPGSSRSGTTIMTGLFRRLTHEGAARFSFLLSIPAIFASGLFELFAEWDHLAEVGWGPIAIATFVSFVSGWLSIAFLLRYLRTHTTTVFIVYRIALGAILIGLLLAGVLQPMG